MNHEISVFPDYHGAMAMRLRVATPWLAPGELPAPTDAPMRDVGILLDRCIHSLRESLSAERLWLLYTALSGAFPQSDMVTNGLRTFEIGSMRECWSWLLECCAAERPTDRTIRIVAHGVVVDVDHTARHDLHTGIQQVIRKTVPLWARDHEIVLGVWDDSSSVLRSLSADEEARVLRWNDRKSVDTTSDDRETTLIVPWQSVIVIPDVARPPALARLASLGKDSGNHVVGVGYDCIPVVSADQIPWGGSGLFVRYLSVVKHMRRLAGISETATTEFRGFTNALPAQGLSGPIVAPCVLPAERGGAVRAVPTTISPLVLAVGSFEPRKNHLALLHAAECLWREGLEFRLRLIGGMAWGDEVPTRIRQLRHAGRPVEALHKVSDDILSASYSEARFTVFASLHEGYGLPVAESLAAGVPVITSDFGSTAEIAAGGGALTIDPRNDDELISAMRTLLTDNETLNELRAQIAERVPRSWEDYAGELWSFLVEPERKSLAELPELVGGHV